MTIAEQLISQMCEGSEQGILGYPVTGYASSIYTPGKGTKKVLQKGTKIYGTHVDKKYPAGYLLVFTTPGKGTTGYLVNTDQFDKSYNKF